MSRSRVDGIEIRPGDWIELLGAVGGQEDSLRPGLRGRVTWVGPWLPWIRRGLHCGPWRQVAVAWDNGSELFLLDPEDEFRIIPEEEP